MEYITVADVDAILGAGWAGSGDPVRAVMMANAWLGQHIKKAVSYPISEPIKQAGAEIAKDAAAGRLYGARETGVTSKSVKADDVSSSKTYSETARTYTAGESLALALIDPWLRARSGVFFLKKV